MTKHYQQGASLIEALVAVLVLAIGVMGLAGIQARTIVQSRESGSRAVAVQMADDLLDRMQANSPIRATPPAVNPYLTTWNGTPATPPDCAATACTGAQMAAYDITQWKGTLANLMPQGDAQVFQSPTDTSQFGVLIGWSATQAQNEGDATSAAEKTQYSDAISVRNALNQIGTGVAGVACPAGLLCHLVYIRP